MNYNMTTREHIKNTIIKYTVSEHKLINGIEFAKKIGVSIGAVNKWKKGECIPDVNLFEKICLIFGISINEFLGIENNNSVSDFDKELLNKIKSNPTLFEYICKVTK